MVDCQPSINVTIVTDCALALWWWWCTKQLVHCYWWLCWLFYHSNNLFPCLCC